MGGIYLSQEMRNSLEKYTNEYQFTKVRINPSPYIVQSYIFKMVQANKRTIRIQQRIKKKL